MKAKMFTFTPHNMQRKNTKHPAVPPPTTSLVAGEGSRLVKKINEAERLKKEIVLFSQIAQTDPTIFSEYRPRTKIILMAKSLNESSFVRPSIDVRNALVKEGNVPYSTTADFHALKELNGEKTNDLVFLDIEGTVQDKNKQEQDMSSSKNVVAVFWRCSNNTAQEKCAGLIKGDIYGDLKSITAILEILLSPTKDEVTYCALPKVSFYSAHTHTHFSNSNIKKTTDRNINNF